MTVCTSPIPSADICPSEADMLPQVLALLPRGRAWQTHDGGPWPGTTLYGFWAAVAAMRSWFNQRICDMRRQFFCATTDEMLDVWLQQYGLPDDCDAFPDLCDKVRAIGGQTCAYFQERCARKGWIIDCLGWDDFCGAQAGCARAGASSPAYASNLPRAGRMRAGQYLGCAGMPAYAASARAGARNVCAMVIRVFTASSSAYAAPTVTPPRAGRLRAGQKLSCADTGIAAVQCLIERIAPAHAVIQYQVI